MKLIDGYEVSTEQRLLIDNFYSVSKLPMETYVEVGSKDTFIENFDKNIDVLEQAYEEQIATLRRALSEYKYPNL